MSCSVRRPFRPTTWMPGRYLVDERTLNPVQDQGHAQPCAMQLARERDALPLRSAAGEAGHVDRDRPGPTVRSGRRSRLPCGLVAIAVRRHLHAACAALPSHPARRLILPIRPERLNTWRLPSSQTRPSPADRVCNPCGNGPDGSGRRRVTTVSR